LTIGSGVSEGTGVEFHTFPLTCVVVLKTLWDVPNSVTLDDLERRNRRVISPNSVAFGTDYVKVVEDTPILSAAKMQAK